MKGLNGFAGILLAVYLIAVVYQNNSTKFVDQLSNQIDFVKWIFALAILAYISREFKSQFMSDFFSLIVVGFLLAATERGNIDKAAEEIAIIFKG